MDNFDLGGLFAVGIAGLISLALFSLGAVNDAQYMMLGAILFAILARDSNA